jgi:hypothetical protein
MYEPVKNRLNWLVIARHMLGLGILISIESKSDTVTDILKSSRRQKRSRLKGTGTRDHNWLKVIWFDRPWSRESLADIHSFLNSGLIDID